VFVTGRPDVLVVVCAGRPRPAQWLRTLRAAGYDTLARRHASSRRLNRSEPRSEADLHRSASLSMPNEPSVPRVQPRSAALRKLTPATSTSSGS
jgi:hypothetical protein